MPEQPLSDFFGAVRLVRGNDSLDLLEQEALVYAGGEAFGMAPFHRLRQRGPLQDGESDLGFRLDPRRFRLRLTLRPTASDGEVQGDPAGMYSARRLLLNWLKPDALPLRFQVRPPDGVALELLVHLVGGLNFTWSGREGMLTWVTLELEAPDPLWRSLATRALMVLPAAFGKPQPLTYPGTWASFPQFELNGPLTNPTLQNLGTGAKISLNGSLAEGQHAVIDLTYGEKRVYLDPPGTSLLTMVTPESDLEGFCLLPAPQVTGGNNSILVTASGANANSWVGMAYWDRYVGI